jgi:hypothetical protein
MERKVEGARKKDFSEGIIRGPVVREIRVTQQQT